MAQDKPAHEFDPPSGYRATVRTPASADTSLADVHLWLALARVPPPRLQPDDPSRVATLPESMRVLAGSLRTCHWSCPAQGSTESLDSGRSLIQLLESGVLLGNQKIKAVKSIRLAGAEGFEFTPLDSKPRN